MLWIYPSAKPVCTVNTDAMPRVKWCVTAMFSSCFSASDGQPSLTNVHYYMYPHCINILMWFNYSTQNTIQCIVNSIVVSIADYNTLQKHVIKLGSCWYIHCTYHVVCAVKQVMPHLLQHKYFHKLSPSPLLLQHLQTPSDHIAQ